MMPTELHRRRRFFRNVFHLLLALLTYIIFLLLLYRNSLPQIREKTTVPRQQGNTVVSPDEHEEERPVVQGLVEPFADDWVLPSPQSQASLQPSPGVVWLMSFGGSGTSYTITNVETSTGTTTATNYAESSERCVGVLPPDSSKPSPCLHKPEKLGLPNSYILTKTHCGGYCMDCVPNAYVHSKDSFELACRTAKLNQNGVVQEFSYGVSLVERAVHLVRNPFDNLIGRMHLGRKRRRRNGLVTDAFEDTPEGLAAWCRELDQHVLERERKSPLIPKRFIEKYAHVPCHAEWFRLAQWHTRTVQVIERIGVPFYVLYYENYTTNFDETTKELLDFLQLDAIHKPYPFHPGKTYLRLFDTEHIAAATDLVREMASGKAWDLMRHYFESAKETAQPQPETDGFTPRRTVFPSIGLLMSFPNSGTSYTISNAEHVSMRTTASNYGTGLSVHPKLPDGPYLHRSKLQLPPVHMLTKTHCMGYCDNCRPRSFLVASTEDFLRGCLSVERMVNETRTHLNYNASLVSRAVHLFRDPFDNIVARMHLAVKRRRKQLKWSEETLANFTNNRKGLLAWCDHVDTQYRSAFFKVSNISEEIKGLMEEVPCSLDWYRWTQWHNRAIEVTEAQKLPVHYLYYERYSTAYNQTLRDLLDFLELPFVEEPLPFYSGKTYRDHYLEEEIDRATRLVKKLASPACWSLVRHYFKSIDTVSD